VPDTITPAMDKAELYQTTRRRFMAHLQYTRGYPKTTCYNYHSDLNLWAAWLGLAGVDWTDAHHTDVEAFIGWQMRERGVKAHIVARRCSALSTFYRFCLRHALVTRDPVQGAARPRRPQRIPVWLEPHEQALLEAAINATDDLPENIFGERREALRRVRERYRVLFGLILNSGLRIAEALNLRVSDVRQAGGSALSVRVIGKGDRERIVPLPERFGPVLGEWLADRPGEAFVFAREPGGKPPGAQAARAYLRRVLSRIGLDRRITPHKLRHTYATRLKERGAELPDIRDLLGHADIGTTSIYLHVSEDHMRDLVSKL